MKKEEPLQQPAGNEDVAANPNPRANENIRVRSEEEKDNHNESGVGSEITDGEDA